MPESTGARPRFCVPPVGFFAATVAASPLPGERESGTDRVPCGLGDKNPAPPRVRLWGWVVWEVPSPPVSSPHRVHRERRAEGRAVGRRPMRSSACPVCPWLPGSFDADMKRTRKVGDLHQVTALPMSAADTPPPCGAGRSRRPEIVRQPGAFCPRGRERPKNGPRSAPSVRPVRSCVPASHAPLRPSYAFPLRLFCALPLHSRFSTSASASPSLAMD